MFVNQKSQETCLAVVRLSSYVRRPELKNRLEKLSFQLVEEIMLRRFEAATEVLKALEAMIFLSRSLYEIDSANADKLIAEFEYLNLALRGAAGIDKPAENLALSMNLNSASDGGFSNASNEINGINSNSGMEQNSNGINSVIRQSAILDRIRQLGKVAIKDIIAEFPDVSERTLRYDLQKLTNQGTIERTGNSGPATYYTIRQS